MWFDWKMLNPEAKNSSVDCLEEFDRQLDINMHVNVQTVSPGAAQELSS